MSHPGKHTTLPHFAPVPRAKDRSNGWKPEVQRAFIEALAELGSVRDAARRVGRAEVGAYMLRRHPDAESFRAAWDAALDIGMRRIEDVAMERALNGVEVPVYSYGKLVGTRTVYNDRLLMFMLRNRAPERFGGAKAMSAADRQQLDQLKQQWREEWEREYDEDEQQVLDSIDAFLDGMRNNRLANMGPRTRAAYEDYLRIEREEGTSWMLDETEEDEDEEQPLALPAPREDDGSRSPKEAQ